MKIEIEGTQEEILRMFAVFGLGVVSSDFHSESMVVVGDPETAVSPVVKQVETPADGGQTAEKPANKRTPVEKVSADKAEGKADDDPGKQAVVPEVAKMPEPVPEKPETPPVATEKPKATPPKADNQIALPDGWLEWTPEERNTWIKGQTNLAPSQKFKLLQDARAADDAKLAAETPPEAAVVKPTPETKPEEPGKPTAPVTPPTAGAGAGVTKLPDWEKWSLAKRIVWVTSLNAADTNQVVELLGFRKEVGDVTEDNLQVARRKLQIAMRMREQVNGKGK